MPDIKSNLESLRQKISAAAQKSGRKLEDIKLVAVTKTTPVELIEQAIQAGITDVGENRVQEAAPKISAVKEKYPQVTWHMVGHLQRNKVRQALECFDMIQSLDSLRLAQELETKNQTSSRGDSVRGKPETRGPMPVLIEVNTSGEGSKFGAVPEQTIELVRKISGFRNIKIQGLMTIGLFSGNIEQVRPCFKKLRQLYEEAKTLNLPNVEMKYLSMGMTDDFEAAIQEGSNMVRIGRAIFGERRG